MKGFRLLCRISALYIFFSSNLSAQDVHLSQFDAAPIFFNPALVGTSLCEHRFIGNMKRQWGNYNSYMVSYDRKIVGEDLPFNVGGDLGAGILVSNDVAGETRMGTTEIRLIPAYHKYIIGQALKLDVGANFDIAQSRIDGEKVVLPNGVEYENSAESKFFFDIDLGVNLGATIKQRYPVNFGVALFHLVRSKKSFVTGESTEDKPRLSFNANTIIPVLPVVELHPSAIYMNQKTYGESTGGYNEFVGGSWARYDISNQVKQLNAILLGAFVRMTERSNEVDPNRKVKLSSDSFIVGVAGEAPVALGTLNVGISYDITASKDYNESKARGDGGSFELSIKYFFCKRDFEYTPPAKLNPVFN